MADKDLSRKAHTALTERDAPERDAWWYETKGGITVLIRKESPRYILCCKITWRALREALARKDRKVDNGILS
jgi:hypothetical protein